MAKDIQGMLIQIEASTAQLRQEMKRADAAVANATKGIDRELSLVDKAFERMGLSAEKSKRVAVSAMKNIGTAIGAAAAAGAAGLATLVVKTAESAREIQNLSRVANASTTEFQRYAAGAKTVGIEQDKLSDILKDVNDRVGDFLTTGGGEMKDFFENIAPRIGVTAEQFRKLSGPQALQLFYSSLEKANLSQAEMTFYMEAMANDTTALIPLLKNGGAGFKEMGDQAQAMGAVLSDLEIKQLEEFTRSTDEMKLAFRGASNQITTDLLPTIKDLTGLLKDPATVDAARVMASGVGQALVYIVERSVDAINWMRRLKGEIADNDIALLEAEIKRVTGMLDGSVLDRTILFGRDGVVEYYDDAELNAELVKLVVAVNKAKADASKGPVKIEIEAPNLGNLPPLLKSTSTSADGAAKAIEKVDKALDGVDADGPAKAIKEFKDRFDDLHDSLNPAEVAARKYKDQQEFLNEVIARGGDEAVKATRDLDLLREQYEANNHATSEWAQWTEGALDRVDGAFADAWRNIGDGFSSFRDSLTDAFKQMLAELAHMAITKPIIMQLGASMGIGNGTQGNNGIWGSLLGGSSGSGGGGTDVLGTVNQARSLYSAYGTASSLWPALSGGYASGGFGGALSAGVSGIGSMFGLGSGAAASMAAGSTAAGYTGAAYASWAAAQGAAGAGAAAAGAGGLGAGMMAKLGAMASNPVGWFIAAITGMYQSGKLFDSGIRISGDKIGDYDDDTNGLGKVAWAPFRVAATAIEKMDKLLASVVGDKTAAMLTGSPITEFVMEKLGSKLFGGAWETKDGGVEFGASGGDFSARQYIDQKKDGGWFSSSKKRTKYSALDEETLSGLQDVYAETQASVASIFESLSLTVEEGSLDGLNLARKKIKTKGKSQEKISEAINAWFGTAAEAMTAELNKVFSTGLDYDLAGMQAFVGNLQGVNEVLRYLDVSMYDASVAGGKLAESLSLAAGGLDALATNSQTYYAAFFTDAEKVEDTIDSITRTFESADVELAASREAYRAMVEDIDLTTEAGQEMFATLMALSGQAATYFSIVEQQAAQAAQVAQALLGANVNSAYGTLQRSIQTERDRLTRNYQAQLAAEQQAASARSSAYADMTSTANSSVQALRGLDSALDRALKTLLGTSDTAVEMMRKQAVSLLQDALTVGRSGKSLAGVEGLEDALDAASRVDTAIYGSLTDFEREQGRTANLIAELEAINGKQLTAEEQLLAQLQASSAALQGSIGGVSSALTAEYERAMAALDEELAAAQSQLDALNGIDNSVLTVAAAVAQMSAAVTAALNSQTGTTGNSAMIDQLYKSITGSGADSEGQAHWQGRLSAGDTYTDLISALKLQAGAAAYDPAADTQAIIERLKWQAATGVPAFARGGFHAGGLRLVGESGPELEVTGPSRIYSASQTAAMLGGGGSTEELRALRGEVAGLRSALGAIAKYTESTAYGVRQMNEIGLPQEEAA